MVFSPSDIFHFRFFGCPLGYHPGSLRQKCDPGKYLRNSNKRRLWFFYPSGVFHIRSFDCHLGSHPGSLLQTYCPGKYSQNSSKRCLRVLPIRHFPFWLLLVDPWDPILRSCGKSVILTSTCAIQLKVVYGFLPIRRFLFSLI